MKRLLELKCERDQLVQAVERFLREKEAKVKVKRVKLGGHEQITYRLNFFKKLMLMYYPQSRSAVITCSSNKLLTELLDYLRNALGSKAISAGSFGQTTNNTLVKTLLGKAVEARLLRHKVKWSKRLLTIYLSIMVASLALLPFSTQLLFVISLSCLVCSSVLLFAPHDRWMPVRWMRWWGGEYSPILYFHYRRKLGKLENYIERYLPLLSEEQRKLIKEAT